MYLQVLLANMGEIPDRIWFAMFSLIPMHLFPGGMLLAGHGATAACCQAVALLGLLVLTFFVCRSPKRSTILKVAILPVGYPTVTLMTNLIPVLISHMTGSFYQPQP